MKQSHGDFGSAKKDHLPSVRNITLPKNSYVSGRGIMGRLPNEYSGKSYMVFGKFSDDMLEEYGHNLGGWSFKMPKITVNVNKFINSIGKAFESIASIVQNTLQAAVKVVKSITPPALHKYIDIVVNPLPLITNPTATITKLLDPRALISVVTNPMAQIKYVLDPKPKLEAVNYTYKNVLKPIYKEIANATAELALKPINNVLDESVYKVLPSSLADKLEKITDMPEQAARGKLTASVLGDATMAYLQILTLPVAVGGYVANSAVDWARKDAILGHVLAKFDSLTGGLLASAQNLANTGQEVYYERDIDWKKKILDGVMVYLAVTGASAFAQMIATNYVGEQTGLSSTPIGRDTLLATRVYLTGSWDAKDAAFEFSNTAAKEAGKAVLTETAKREIITEAAKKGIIDRKTLEDLVKYGGAVYGTQNPDGTYNSEALVSVSKDAAYQEFIREEVRRRTGLDLSLKDLAEIYGYGMNPQSILDNMDAALNKAIHDKENIDKVLDKAVSDYENFDSAAFIKNEMPRFQQNVKDELQKYADGNIDKFVQWAVNKLGPQKANNPANYTPELLAEYENSVLDLTGQPVPKKGKLNPMVFGAGIAIMAGAAFLIMED